MSRFRSLNTAKFWRRLFGTALRTLFHPVFVVTIAGPTIISLNMLILGGKVKDPHLLEVLKDPVADAVRDHNIQLYTLILSAIVFLGIVIRWFMESNGDKLVEIIREVFHNREPDGAVADRSIIWMGIVSVSFVAFVWILFNGGFTTPDTIVKYVSSPERIASNSLHPPPFSSPITIGRAIIVILTAFHYMIARVEERKSS